MGRGVPPRRSSACSVNQRIKRTRESAQTIPICRMVFAFSAAMAKLRCMENLPIMFALGVNWDANEVARRKSGADHPIWFSPLCNEFELFPLSFCFPKTSRWSFSVQAPIRSHLNGRCNWSPFPSLQTLRRIHRANNKQGDVKDRMALLDFR